MTTLRMKYMNRQGTSCFRARTWATPDFSISQWGEGVHLARGQRHTQAAHTAGCDLEQTESLSSNNSASFSTAGVGPASQGCPLWPNAIPCPLLALSLCSPSPTRSQNVAKTQAMIGRRGAGVPIGNPTSVVSVWWLWLACSTPEGEVVGSGDFALFTVGSVWHGADTQFPTFSCVRSSVYLSRGTSGTVKSLRFGSVSIITALH